MNAEMKKKLAKNWFKILQDMVCRDIEELERGKKFIVTEWKQNKKKVQLILAGAQSSELVDHSIRNFNQPAGLVDNILFAGLL